MFSNLLIKMFIKNPNKLEDETVRTSYGYMASIVGVIANIILFVVKLMIGLITASIAITADAFNNLSDAISSVITIVGFKFAAMPADKEHPYGHGRFEYIAALIVAFIVMIVGFEFARTSFERIIHPSPVKFALIPFILLIVTIFIKIWLSIFNKTIGKKINSAALKATALDALGDVFASTCVAISLLLAKFTSFPIDGYVGVAISLFIIYAGISLIKETINPLIGEAPDPEFVKKIEEKILSYKYISSVHDLIIHNYGVGKSMASIHVEFPSDVDILEMHNIIDEAEREMSEHYNLYLTIHMDPIYLAKGQHAIVKSEIEKMVEYNPIIKSMHDFRIIECSDRTDLRFDIVVNGNKSKNVMTDEELISFIKTEIESKYPTYKIIITIDKEFNI